MDYQGLSVRYIELNITQWNFSLMWENRTIEIIMHTCTHTVNLLGSRACTFVLAITTVVLYYCIILIHILIYHMISLLVAKCIREKITVAEYLYSRLHSFSIISLRDCNVNFALNFKIIVTIEELSGSFLERTSTVIELRLFTQNSLQFIL